MKNKKNIKRIGITLGVLFLFGTGVALGSALDTWEGIGGREHADNTEQILDDLDTLLGEKNSKIISLEKQIEEIEGNGSNNEYEKKYKELLKELEEAKKDVIKLESKGQKIYDKHK